MQPLLTVTLQRKDKITHILLRQDDYTQSIRVTRDSLGEVLNIKMKYGSGPMWTVRDVK